MFIFKIFQKCVTQEDPKKTLIKDKIGTCHFTDFGLCKASLIEHLSVTELPA